MEELSPREVEVLSHVAQGETDKTIGQALGIAEQTTKNHMAAILAKMGANNRAHAAVMWTRQKSVKYLEEQIAAWRDREAQGDARAQYYIDAFRSVKAVLFEVYSP